MTAPDLTALRGKTVAVDFDGVLHAYTRGWTGEIPEDPPMPGALDFVVRLLDAGAEVVVYTTRASTPGGLAATCRWLERYAFPADRLRVTDGKPMAVAYVDDRAVPFDRTLGAAAWENALDGCSRLAAPRRG